MAGTPLQIEGEAAQEPKLSVVDVLVDSLKRWVFSVQDYSLLSARSIKNLASSPRYFQDTLDQMDDIGVGSLPIVLISGFFIGAVMVLQTGSQFTRFGQAALTGDIVAIALVRELGPTLTGILVAG
ncbi:MAG TPA: ABC transporter permease, partial [Candidatus Acidoferrum sp.]